MLAESRTMAPDQAERNWAMLAHLTALLTVGVGLSTGGLGMVFALLVPLAMYLYFAGRSRYVAFHALQATVFQALGALAYVGVAALAGAAIATAWVVVGVLSLLLVGFLLLPVALGLTLLGGLEVALGPIIWLGFALRGAFLTYHGEDFEYPGIGRLVARSMQLPPAPSSQASAGQAPPGVDALKTVS